MKTHLTTTDKPPSDRLEFWQEVVCKRYVSASAVTDLDASDFSASLVSRDLGPLVVAELDAPLHYWSRKAAHVRNDGQDVFIVSLITRGRGELRQFQRHARPNVGDLVLYDSGAPFDYDLDARTRLLKIPKPVLQSRLDKPMDFVGRPIGGGHALVSVLGDLIGHALEIEAEGTAARRLSNSIVDLFSSICELQRQNRPDARATGALERAQHFARGHIEDERLTPEAMAQAAGVSVRTLSRLFAAIDTTPMRWVWAQRLEASRRALIEGRARSVTEAALTHGFSELGHFSRSFKKAFGVSPQRAMKR